MKKTILTLAIATLLSSTSVFADVKDASTNPDEFYLTYDAVADSNAYLPAEPKEGTAAFVQDELEYEKGLSNRTGKLGKFAKDVAEAPGNLQYQFFSEPFGIEISPKNTPELAKLLSNMAEDAGALGTKSAKDTRSRTRPFAHFNTETCTTAGQKGINPHKSYPSGHTAIAFANALVLIEVDPTNQTALMKRAFEIADARVNCGYHWRSDVQAGSIVGAATVASLHANERFQEQLAKAKAEIKKIKESKK